MLGEEINCLGYPGIGGSRSIYGITLTRGIAAGFIARAACSSSRLTR